MVVTRDVQEAIEAFGHSPAQISEILLSATETSYMTQLSTTLRTRPSM
jgi:hypothetical protein